jgi:hypothetical protein
MRCERRRRLSRAREPAYEGAVHLLRQRVKLGLLPGERKRASSFATGLGLVGRRSEDPDTAAALLVPRLDCPLFLDAGKELAVDRVEQLRVASVDPDSVAVGKPDSVACRDQSSLGVRPEDPPDRPHRVAQARPRAGVEHVRPEPSRDARSGMEPGVESQPREQLGRAAVRQFPPLALDLDAQLPDQMDAHHRDSAYPADARLTARLTVG